MALGPGRFAAEPARERPESPPESYGVPQEGEDDGMDSACGQLWTIQ